MKIIEGVSMEHFKAFKMDCLQSKITGEEYFIFYGRIYLTKFALNLIKQYENE